MWHVISIKPSNGITGDNS